MQKKRRILIFAAAGGVLITAIIAAVVWIQAKQVREREEYFLCRTPPASTLTANVAYAEIEFLGMVTFRTGERFEDTEIGGLSAITYDGERDVYYVLSDDRGQADDPRFYTVSVATDGSAVTFEAVTFLLDEAGDHFDTGSIDPEGIALLDGQLLVSSEGHADIIPPIDPSVRVFALDGTQTSAYPIPDKFLPNRETQSGIEYNKAFEALTRSPDGQFLYTAVENALLQDRGLNFPAESYSRVLQFDTAGQHPLAETVYITNPVVDKGITADNGLVELIALDNEGQFLALERSYALGIGNTVQLVLTSTVGATNVSGLDALWDAEADEPADWIPMQRTLLTHLADLGIDPDNVEGMALGPLLDDGRQVLVLVSDNNFNPLQTTQFIVLAIALK